MTDQVKILKLSLRILQNRPKGEGSSVNIYTYNPWEFLDCSQTQGFLTKSWRRLFETWTYQQNKNPHSRSHQEQQTVMHAKPLGGMNLGTCGVVSPFLRGHCRMGLTHERGLRLPLSPKRLRVSGVSSHTGWGRWRWNVGSAQGNRRLQVRSNKTTPKELSELWGRGSWETRVSSTLAKNQSMNTAHYYNGKSITNSESAWWDWRNPGYF